MPSMLNEIATLNNLRNARKGYKTSFVRLFKHNNIILFKNSLTAVSEDSSAFFVPTYKRQRKIYKNVGMRLKQQSRS